MKNVYDGVEGLYQEKIITFQKIEKIFNNDFGIDEIVIRDTIKRMLVETFNSGQKEHLLKYQFNLKSFFIYYFVMFYFLLLSLFGLRERNSQKFDILVENWSGNNFELFYKRIYSIFFTHYKIAIFDVAKESSIDFYPTNSVVIRKKSNHRHFYARNISFKIFKKQFSKFFYYKKISQESGLDILNIVLRLQRYIAVYNTDILNLKAKVLISAGDNYYSSIRYYIYTNGGIDKILLIQNGYRAGSTSNSSGDMYTYCDYYLGFGIKNIEEQKGMICQNKLPIGSLRLYDNILNLSNTILEYDIVFIEQLVLGEWTTYSENRYLEIISMLCQFAMEHKEYNIVYKTRPNRLNRYATNREMIQYINQLDVKLKKANIIIDDGVSQSSYEAIIKSNIILYYTSTMGIEALGLDKKVLCYNPDKISFQIAVKDEIGCLVDNSYELFEKKLLYLLNNDTNEIKEYYQNKKEQYMNLMEDPTKIIQNIIKKNIKREKNV